MSIYATGHQFLLSVYVPCTPEENKAAGGAKNFVKERWVEVYFQHVPNHINEENGYDWDWLPAFIHKPGCKRDVAHFWIKDVYEDLGIVTSAKEGEPGARPDSESTCKCGDRCVFVLDEDHQEKAGQRYTEPLMVLTGAEYETAKFSDLMGLITEALEARIGVTGAEASS